MDRRQFANLFLRNWASFPGFVWIDPPENKDAYGVYYLDHKCSDVTAICNSNVILKRLSKFNPNVIKHTFAHYGVGWINAIAVRVYEEDGKEFTKAFIELHKIINDVLNRKILDIDEYNKMLVDVTVANIEYMAEDLSLLKNDVPKRWPHEAFNWFIKNNQRSIENQDDRGGWPTKEELVICLMELGYLDPEFEDSDPDLSLDGLEEFLD